MRTIIILAIGVSFVVTVHAQIGSSISADGSAPNDNAMLDVQSSMTGAGKGMLIPRVTLAQRTTANASLAGGLLDNSGNLRGGAAQGLIVYQTDGDQGLYFNTSLTAAPTWAYPGDVTGLLASNVWAAAASTTNYLPLTGGTMSGALNMGGQVVSNVASIDFNGDNVTIGRAANGASMGMAVGNSAIGTNYGLAVGPEANGSKYGAAMGRSANGYDSGAAMGRLANAYNWGAAMGTSANSYNSGAAMGSSANSYDFGAAVGYSAIGTNSGAALGHSANGSDGGAAMGYSANGYFYGAAMGRSANGYYYGAAMGREANGSSVGAALGYLASGICGVAVGYLANGCSYSAALGYRANGYNFGVAVGDQANGSVSGAAVGFLADAYGDGVAMGRGALGGNFGAAVGRSANGMSEGASLGCAANSPDNGVALGYRANGYNYGMAAGKSANGIQTNIAIGVNADAQAGTERIAIGHNVTNTQDNSARIRGNLYLDGGSSIYTNGGTFGSGDWGIKAFTIDHPLDPENKVLRHYCLEGPVVQNVYNGRVQLDAGGEAIVELPAYFEALNADPQYVLTAVGMSMPGLYVKQEVKDNRFVIGGGVRGGKVCWEVKARRNDPACLEDLRQRPVEQMKRDLSR